MVTPARAVYRYRIDQDDRIVDVDTWWLAFAKENSAAELNESAVLGRSVWNFISDDPTRALYREIHRYVRCSGNPVRVPFRCDSPTLQRYMQLTISKHHDEHLQYESVLLRALPQHRLTALDPQQQRSDSVLTMCSFCKRSLIEPAGWLELENIALQLRLYHQQQVPDLRYTVCPACAEQTNYQLA